MSYSVTKDSGENSIEGQIYTNPRDNYMNSVADLPYLSIESGVFVDSVRLKHRGARWQVLWH